MIRPTHKAIKDDVSDPCWVEGWLSIDRAGNAVIITKETSKTGTHHSVIESTICRNTYHPNGIYEGDQVEILLNKGKSKAIGTVVNDGFDRFNHGGWAIETHINGNPEAPCKIALYPDSTPTGKNIHDE